ncbi:MAG: PKD domain-containing protein [Planctomycetota bacterium]|nr:PKD domain-containing protein [Planctomycetota bacterium]
MKRNKKRSSAKHMLDGRGFELLEDRRLLSSATFAAGVLNLQGDANQDNTFYVQPASSNRVLGYADNYGQTANVSELSRIVVHTGSQNNTVSVAKDTPMVVEVIAPDGSTTILQPGDTKTFGASSGDKGTGAGSGSTGGTGSTGNTGGTGSTGGTGNPGSTGSTGDTGSTGSTGGTGSTGSTGDTGSNNGGATARDSRAPVSVITVTSGATILPGESTFVHALDSSFGNGDALNSKIAWDFGDPGSSHDNLVGFNASHAYDRPGTYTVTLTITNQSGFIGTTTQKITVSADTRQTIYVAANGNDSNDGLSPNAPVNSIDRVSQLITSNTRILFHNGDTFTTSGSLNINGLSNVYVGSYGQGAKPILMYNGPQTFGQIINLSSSDQGVTIEGLTFDSVYTNEFDDSAIASGIRVNGGNITIRNNTFLNLLSAMDMSGSPNNVLVENNTAPSVTGLRAYFTWVQGSDISIIGNTVANSTREHIVRIAGATRVLVADNNLSNISGVLRGDSKDTVKGAITVQYGSWAYVTGNVVPSGPVTVGPLTITDPGPQSNHNAFMQNTVLDGNTFNDAVLFQPGAHDTVVRNNVVHANGSQGFTVNPQESLYDRQVVNLYLLDNTVTDTAITGGFMRISTGVAQNIVVDNNLFYAPNFITGNDQAVIYVTDSSLQSFGEIRNNVWPTPQVYNYARGGYFYVNPQPGIQSGFLTPAEWESLGLPSGDIYNNVTLGSTYQVTLNGTTAGSNLLQT